jgi:hypothetical protein
MMNRRAWTWIAIAGAAVSAGAIGLAASHRTRSPAPPVAAALRPPGVEKPRVIARVGGRDITNVALARYRLVKQLSVGVTGERQALEDVCDRALLLEAAGEQHLEVGDAELHEGMFRLRLLIGGAASIAPSSLERAWAAPPVPIFDSPGEPALLRRAGPVSPLDLAAELISRNGVTEEDLAEEAKSDLLADKAAQKLVYDSIVVSRNDVLAAVPRTPPPDTATLDRVRRRLQRERGATKRAALLIDLRSRFKVQIET